MTPLDLAAWIVARQPGLTHLKLQKLAFYCFGYALADARAGLVDELGPVAFHAWKHGPVEISVYRAYSASRALPIATPVGAVPRFSPHAEDLLVDVVDVYGRLSAWELREETHLEAPWREAFTKLEGSAIPRERIREHFRGKILQGNVLAPVHLVHGNSAELDGLHQARYQSFKELAEVVRLYA